MSEKQPPSEEKTPTQPAQRAPQAEGLAEQHEKELSPEVVEAEKTATQKLELLMRPDFKEFAVRFMNIDEYRKMIKNAASYKRELKRRQEFIYEVGAGEVYVPKLEEGMEPPTFREYLERSRENWLYVAGVATDSPQGVEGRDKAYTLAVVFGLSLVDLTWREKRFGIRGYAWGAIRPEVKRKEFAGNLLGSIAIIGDMPAQELIELSSKSGKFANPVFDSRGIVCWPKKMSYEEVKQFVAEREKKGKEKRDKH